jgi:hypothetical protein
MRRCSSMLCLLSLACAGTILIGCQTSQSGAAIAPPNSGHLLVYRVANFGTDLSLVVSVDGKDVGSFTEGRNYDGYLPAGQHRLAVRVDPNRVGTPPARKALNVNAGQIYSYTAAWSGGKLALVRNQ